MQSSLLGSRLAKLGDIQTLHHPQRKFLLLAVFTLCHTFSTVNKHFFMVISFSHYNQCTVKFCFLPLPLSPGLTSIQKLELLPSSLIVEFLHLLVPVNALEPSESVGILGSGLKYLLNDFLLCKA